MQVVFWCEESQKMVKCFLLCDLIWHKNLTNQDLDREGVYISELLKEMAKFLLNKFRETSLTLPKTSDYTAVWGEKICRCETLRAYKVLKLLMWYYHMIIIFVVSCIINHYFYGFFLYKIKAWIFPENFSVLLIVEYVFIEFLDFSFKTYQVVWLWTIILTEKSRVMNGGLKLTNWKTWKNAR